MWSTGDLKAAEGAAAKTFAGRLELASKVGSPAKFGEVLAALASSPEIEFADPATLWPATPSPGRFYACKASQSPMVNSAFTLMFSLPGMGCLVPAFDSKIVPAMDKSTGGHSLDTETRKACSFSNKTSPTACSPIAVPPALVEEETCTVCADPFSMPENCHDAADGFSVDGKRVCEPCRKLFSPEPFVPKNQVCGNPLCRRKWKQLTPKALPFFCPPCKRDLEKGLPAHPSGLETAPIEVIYERWHNIFSEIAEAVGYPAPASKFVQQPPQTFKSSEQAREHWRDVLAAFEESFKSLPPSADVRNWNSVFGRRKHYRGIVHRRHHQHCVSVEALEELNADLTPLRQVTSGMREFLHLDWHQQLEEGQEVHFVVFPNPSVDERGKVSRLIRLLNMPDEAGEKRRSHSLAPQPTGVAADNATCDDEGIHSSCSTSSLSSSFGEVAFADLMNWSQEELVEPEAPAGAFAARGASAVGAAEPGIALSSGGASQICEVSSIHSAQGCTQHPMQLSLRNCLLLGGDGALHKTLGINLCEVPAVHAFSAPLSCPKGNPPLSGTWVPSGVPQGAVGAGPGSGQGQVGLSRSPMICPRSPYAAYFGD